MIMTYNLIIIITIISLITLLTERNHDSREMMQIYVFE